ncbi:MAG: phospho-sugar mutase [Leucobacter sp.]
MAAPEAHQDREGSAAPPPPDDAALFTAVAAWAEADPDPESRAEALRLLELARYPSGLDTGITEPADGIDGIDGIDGNPAAAPETSDARTAERTAALAQLRDAFTGRLVFGTAGLRGALGAGPRRMNRVVVSQTSAGFARYLLERAEAGETHSPPSVVIGYDGRVNSDVFARDAAEVMTGAGIDVTLLPDAGPTPLTAFAVRRLGVSAGVMITASHNPPRDNGYKVYLGDADGGAQIAPPVDAVIAAHIERAATLPVHELPRSLAYRTAGAELANDYVATTAAAVVRGLPEAADGSRVAHGSGVDLTVVYTAMHGVGSDLARRVFVAAGLPPVHSVAEQDAPDGAFPTVEFPNPEEPGALDLAFRDARAIGADLVVAHDPDADRLGLAAPDPAAPEGFRMLTGNEVGLLLGWRAAEREHRRAALAGEEPHGALACTIVSSPALGAVAREYGLEYAETLSGFKWVSRVPGLLFGFEEALGYLTHPAVVHDKDGISAGADAIAMARECAAEGRSLWDLLDEASERFGHFASRQVTLRLESMAAASTLAARVRREPPQEFAGIAVADARDLLEPGLAEAPADVLRYDLVDGSRVMIRPSGTEPKLKVYLDTFGDEGSAAERRATASALLTRIEASVREYFDLLQAEG